MQLTLYMLYLMYLQLTGLSGFCLLQSFVQGPFACSSAHELCSSVTAALHCLLAGFFTSLLLSLA